jgi:hypothetical protein
MPTLVPIRASSDGPRITVNELMKTPNIIPRRVLKLMDNEFIADAVLRDGGAAPSGIVEFEQSTPLFADSGSSIRSEFGEYQIVQSSLGTPMVVATVDRGMSMRVSDEMKSRNQVDLVNTQSTQISNTLIRDWDLAFQTAMLAGVSQILDVSGTRPWAAQGVATIRTDIMFAKKTIKNVTTGQANNFLAYNPDTIIMGVDGEFDIESNNTFNSLYRGNVASDNLGFNGALPTKILGLDPLVSRTWPTGFALVCERKTIGFISDEESLQATPMYRDQEHRCWRSDINRKSAIGLDQPNAGLLIKFA